MSIGRIQGKAGAWWLPTMAGTGPTTAELAAGIPLHAGLNAMTGFDPQSNKIDIDLMKYDTSVQIGGPQTFQNVQLTFAEDDDTGTGADDLERQAILTTMTADASGVLVLSRFKQVPVAADPVYAMRATVDSQVPVWALGANAAFTNVNLLPSTPLDKVAVLA